VSGVAHDVNNSLTIVRCCTSELREMTTSSSTLELVSDIESATQAAT
jgi:hypothetical protein